MKARRGRPPLSEKVQEIHIHLRLRVESDADLIEFFARIPPKMRATKLKIALRAGGIQNKQFMNDVGEDKSLSDDLEALLF